MSGGAAAAAILVGDVGGTNTRLALARRQGDGWSLGQLQVSPTGDDVAAAVATYAAAQGGPALSAIALCGAGPVLANGCIRLTNARATLDPVEMARAAGAPRSIVVNDFEAVAHCLPLLGPSDLRACGGGVAQANAPCIVLGPGTGLGIAHLVPAGGGWSVLSGEGGHADLAPVDPDELVVWKQLYAQHGRVSAELVFSGPGLERLHAAHTGGTLRSASQVTEAAQAGDAAAVAVVQLFTRWLGRLAGNLALAAGARGGVYIAGGIVPGWGLLFAEHLFREGFESKAPMEEWLRPVPSFVITHPQPALLGLARLAACAPG